MSACGVKMSCNSIFSTLNPSKVTFARRLQMHAFGWGPVTSFHLESVKINTNRGSTRSVALVKVGDRYGKVTVMLEGQHIAVLFGLAPKAWLEIEKLCSEVGELFFRYFKLGIHSKYSIQQKIFYHFCLKKQTTEIFFISFQRLVNTRNGEKTRAFLKVVETSPWTPHLQRLYNEKRYNQR